MVQNNKVLTVSYGTFSCTLEGFEDSFGTMKAIAEYFRDLAADDRYFGAEPPQPDADMLARIAQREVARQVEARTSEEGIHLRAATPPAAPQPTPAPAPATAQPAATRELKELPPGEVDFFVEPEDALQQAESADAPAASEDAPEVYSLDGSAEEPFADDFEDEIDAPAAIADTPADDAPKTFAPGEVDFFVEPEEALAQSQPADTPETAEDAYSFDGSAEEPFADDLEDFEDVEAFEAENAPADASDTTSQADADDDVNLDQIAAIVAARAADTASDDLEEDEPADIPVAEPVVQYAPQPAQNSIAAKLQRIRAVVSRTPTDEFSEDQHADAVSSKAKQKLQDMADDSAELPAAPASSDSYEDESETLISRALEELQSATEDTPAADPAPEPTPETAPETAQALIAEPAEDTPSKPRRARVIRVRRGGGKPAEIAAPAGPPSTLSHEDEDDLRRELAAVEAELLAATRAEAEPEPQDPAPNRAPAASDGDVTRLMAAADEKLGDPDTASSRETYSHMRAAVAAAQGDPDAGVDDVEKDYREDLAQVVQPRRPVVHRKSPRSESAPAAPRPTPVEAPLKLVAEQRVAADPAQPAAQAETATPVRPRRVKTTPQPNAAEAFNADTGFAKYVQDTGAVELNELLEAAAAYLSFVKGQDVFSRPELLNKVRATGTEFNREDSMRSFGQLLRDGKIARRRNGRFAASDQIGFQPQDRAAG